jgi:hypothetical protein
MFAHRSGGKIQPHSFVPNAATVLKNYRNSIPLLFLHFTREPNGALAAVLGVAPFTLHRITAQSSSYLCLALSFLFSN